jgi:hypothetical protein
MELPFIPIKTYGLVLILETSFLGNLSLDRIGYAKYPKTIIFLKLGSLSRYAFIGVMVSFAVPSLYSKAVVGIRFLIYLKCLVAKY